MIGTPVAVQRHLTNHKKKDLCQQKRKKHKHIPDSQEKMELQLIKTFNKWLASNINAMPACKDQIDCF